MGMCSFSLNCIWHPHSLVMWSKESPSCLFGQLEYAKILSPLLWCYIIFIYIFHNLQDDVSEDEACSELRPPHILAIRLQQYVVIIDQTVCSDESSCMEHAMAIFFGLHYLLDLEYQTKLQNTLTFVQKHMLELASDDMPSRVFCLSQKICRFQAQHA